MAEDHHWSALGNHGFYCIAKYQQGWAIDEQFVYVISLDVKGKTYETPPTYLGLVPTYEQAVSVVERYDAIERE